MGNCAGRLTCGLWASVTPDETSSFHSAVEEWDLSSSDEVAPTDCNGAGSSVEQKSDYFSARVEETDEVAPTDCNGAGSSVEQKSAYFSPRVEEMMQSKSQFSSAVEHEIEHSRVHWSKVSGISDFSEDNDDYEKVKRENERVFAALVSDIELKHGPESVHFFMQLPRALKLGQKIAEGGQGGIFELIGLDGKVDPFLLLKVFKNRSRLSEFLEHWPRAILRREVASIALAGVMMDNGKFAFLMTKCWGDLRKLIDQAMQDKNNQGPPFPYFWTGGFIHANNIMMDIAKFMEMLHKNGIIHRDLKASNILLHRSDKVLAIYVADFECSIGVMGTGFWRAPEILLASQNGSGIDFSEKANVYSYGMTCFEIVTGRLPFEGELEVCRASNDLVIEGWRPKLPSDLDVTLKALIERCWNLIPNERPSFSEIIGILGTIPL